MLRGHWREADTPHTVQFALITMVVFGALGDLMALLFVGLSVWVSGASGTYLFWLAQWWALMVPIAVGYVIWSERRMLWQQYRARRQRQALRHAEFDI